MLQKLCYEIQSMTVSVSIKKPKFLTLSLQTLKAGEGVEKREPSYTVGGKVIWYNYHENGTEAPQKTKYRTTI